MRRLFVGILAVALSAPAARAAAMDVSEIVERANRAAYYAGRDGRADVTMTITDAQGRVRERVFTILRRDAEDGGEQKFYVYFRKPEDVRDMVYMVWKHPGADDDRWLYLPALDLVRRVAASDKRSSFVGSHFVYEDISGRSVTEDAHELIREDETSYVLGNTPVHEDGVEFSRYDLYIDKSNFLPVKAEFYDKQGALSKVIEAVRVETISGHPTVIESKVTDVVSSGSTVSVFENVAYDIGLEDDIFTERYLRRAPRQWIR